MEDEIRLNSRRAILFFIGGVTLCFSTFVGGVLIGRWSTVHSNGPEPQADTPVASAKLTVAPEQFLSEAKTPPEPPASESDKLDGQAAEPKHDGPVTFDEPRSYLVRAASFNSPSEAESFAVSLRGRGFETAFTRQDKMPSGERAFLVFLGPYPDTDTAGRAVKELRLEGVSDVSVVPNR